jgi:EpsD family peptidyl-prolyl cis-trans isomerase
MKRGLISLFLGLAILSGCNRGGTTPTGQVAATVDGEEITVEEIAQEIQAASANGEPTPDQVSALRSIVNRKLLRNAAKAEGIEQSPATAIQLAKSRDLVLIDGYTKKLRVTVPKPSDEEVRQYVIDHPASFAQRRIFVVDQIIVPELSDALLKQLEPVETMDQAVGVLARLGKTYRKTIGVIDALSIGGEAAEKMANLPPESVIIFPGESDLRINHVREEATEALSQADSERLAGEIIANQRTERLIGNKVGEIIAAGQKTVRLNPAFAPKRSGAKP